MQKSIIQTIFANCQKSQPRSRSYDDKLAYELSGIKKSKKYTWHHLDDFDPLTGTCTMQLVEKIVHQSTIPHIGSVKIVEEFFIFIYKI